jgi:hypothetical protein
MAQILNDADSKALAICPDQVAERTSPHLTSVET